MTTLTLQDTLQGIRTLPVLPQIAIRLLELLNDPKTSVRDVNNVMSRDPAIAATILRIVNSSYYGLSNRVSSLSHALALLGYSVVRNIVLTAAASGPFRVRTSTPCFDARVFTIHSVASAAVCRYLAHFSGLVDPELAYSVGLLHDIGKLTMDQCFPKTYFDAVMWARRNRKNPREAEENICGYTHSQVGAALVRIWKLPEQLADTILRHHDPDFIVNQPIIAITHIADYTCSLKGFACYDTFLPVDLDHAAWQSLKMDGQILPDLFTSVDGEIENAKQMFLAASG